MDRQFSRRSVLHWCIAAFIAFLVLSDTMQYFYVHVVEQAQDIVGDDQ